MVILVVTDDGKTSQISQSHMECLSLGWELATTRILGLSHQMGKKQNHLKHLSKKTCEFPGCLGFFGILEKSHVSSRLMSRLDNWPSQPGIWSTKDADFITAVGCYRGGRGLRGFLFNLWLRLLRLLKNKTGSEANKTKHHGIKF